MPITTVDLTKRSETGAALTQPQFDQNLEDTQQALNSLIALIELALNDDGTLKDNAITLAIQIADGIITLAKFAALTGADLGGFLRANKTTGVIYAAHLLSEKQSDSDAVASSGTQSGLSLSSFDFADVPAGDVQIHVKLLAQKQAGSANGGTITVKVGSTIIDQIATHPIDNGDDITQWMMFPCFGVLADFAGGALTVDVEFETSEVTSNMIFGVPGENRFGRACQILAGL